MEFMKAAVDNLNARVGKIENDMKEVEKVLKSQNAVIRTDVRRERE